MPGRTSRRTSGWKDGDVNVEEEREEEEKEEEKDKLC
jgi:hypothetical protein